jgi:hypothetical protein
MLRLLVIDILLFTLTIQAFIPSSTQEQRNRVVPGSSYDTAISQNWVLQNESRTTTLVLHASIENDEEEKRLQMIASRRKSIRSMLANADSFKQFRISNGKFDIVQYEYPIPPVFFKKFLNLS